MPRKNCFIAHADEDRAITRALTKKLEERGLAVFVDRVIAEGRHPTEIIREALLNADVVVVVLSSNSGKSRWVKDEVAAALESRKSVIPLLLDDGAKDNWLWPLLSDRQAITISRGMDLDGAAEAIEHVATGRPSGAPLGDDVSIFRAPDGQSAKDWSFAGVAIVFSLIGALLALLAARFAAWLF